MKNTDRQQTALFTIDAPVWRPDVQERAEEAKRILATVKRPETVADCAPDGPCYVRPCPWVTCRYHLLVSDIREDGALIPWEPSRAPGKPQGIAPAWRTESEETALQQSLVERLQSMPNTCAHDVARQLGHTEPSSEQVGNSLGLGAWVVLDAEHTAAKTLSQRLAEDALRENAPIDGISSDGAPSGNDTSRGGATENSATRDKTPPRGEI